MRKSMAAPAQRRRFALDSNVLIDLGERAAFAHNFLVAYQSQGLAVPPTVVQELTHIAFHGDPPDVSSHLRRYRICANGIFSRMT